MYDADKTCWYYNINKGIRDVLRECHTLGLSLDPPDRALGLCVDEKSRIQDINLVKSSQSL